MTRHTLLTVFSCLATLVPGSASALAARIAGILSFEPGTPCGAAVAITNATDKAVPVTLRFTLQRDSQNREPRLPDPRHGSDLAVGCPSWIEVGGERIDDGSLTDGSIHTAHDSERVFQEAFHVVDLGQPRHVTHLAIQSGDANWIWLWDFAASEDGTRFVPVPGLQGVDLHKQWGRHEIPVPSPFEARFLRMRYHKPGGDMRFLRAPSMLQVYDGPSEEEFAFPSTGPVIEEGAVQATLPPGIESLVALGCKVPLETGAYRLHVRLESGDYRQLLSEGIFGLPPILDPLPDDSPFGVNGSAFEYPDTNRRLGVKWIRFENMKWQMSMPGPGRYAFDGSVAPWHVRHDEYVKMYRDRGMKILPYTFQTPRWLSRAPATTQRNQAGHPPKDFADYGDMMFQLAARYGSTRHPEAELKTNDKLSGLGWIDTFQLWNEPNLEGPDWAPWVGSMEEYLELFRIGAEAVKRADPRARVTPAGLAGISVGTVDPLFSHRYADGRRPVDFADILTVHYYSGKQDPEVATLDRNATRSGQALPGAPTYPESLVQLVDWRDDHAPGKPIWITETGNDVGGVMGLGEREQAGKIPRVTMLALAAGVDKVFIYREKGSTPAQHAGAGLTRNDDSTRPVWFTYATLVRQFVGVKPGRAWRIEHPDPDVWIHAWERDGKPFVTAWTIGEEVELGLDLGTCRAVDAFGHARTEEAKTLRLGYYPTYLSDLSNPTVLAAGVESAKAKEAERQRQRKQAAGRKVVLFDFGTRNYAGTLMLGTLRRYTTVLAGDVYDPATGWGFEPGPATRDGVAAWMADPLRKDSVRMSKGQRFRFPVEAGRFRVGVLARAVGGPSSLTLRAGDVTQVFPVTREDDPPEAVLVLPGGDAVLEADGWADLQAVSLVEEP